MTGISVYMPPKRPATELVREDELRRERKRRIEAEDQEDLACELLEACGLIMTLMMSVILLLAG